ncbi:MAG: iron-containing alcohol dehydrogenase, partial [Myxococcales bacterium]|nr:iron-containing alcohol dehydrogenase [Myxococcales bacterium]
SQGIALEGMRLVIGNLPRAYDNGTDIEARAQMMSAAAMGATAFQKGLGMTHSLAHPLSTRYGTHHGLANALLVPFTTAFLEEMAVTEDHHARIGRVHRLFDETGYGGEALSEAIGHFVGRVGIELGLSRHGVKREDFEALSREAFDDPCHQSNMVPVTRETLRAAYEMAF